MTFLWWNPLNNTKWNIYVSTGPSPCGALGEHHLRRPPSAAAYRIERLWYLRRYSSGAQMEGGHVPCTPTSQLYRNPDPYPYHVWGGGETKLWWVASLNRVGYLDVWTETMSTITSYSQHVAAAGSSPLTRPRIPVSVHTRSHGLSLSRL